MASLATIGLALVLAFASWWSQGHARQRIEQIGHELLSEQVEEVLITLVREQAVGIDVRLDFARTLALQNSAILSERYGRSTGDISLSLSRHLEPVLRARDVSFDVFIIGEDGKRWHSLQQEAAERDDEAWYELRQVVTRAADGTASDTATYWSDVHRNPFRITRDLSISVVAPLWHNQHRWGAVVVTCSLSSLIARYNQHQAVPGSYTFILDRDRRLVAAPPHGRVELSAHSAALPSPLIEAGAGADPFAELIAEMALGHRAARRAMLKQQEKYIAHHPLQTRSWSVGLVVPIELIAARTDPLSAAVDQASGEAVSVMVAIAIVTALVALMLAWRLSRRISAPVRRLIQLARAIGNGNFAMRADVPTNDELGDLAEVFNATAAQLEEMVDRLAAQATEIEVAHDSLHQSSAIMEGVFRQMSDALVVVDGRGRSLIANAEAKRLVDVSQLAERTKTWFRRYEMTDANGGGELTAEALRLDRVQSGEQIDAREVIVRRRSSPESADDWICLSLAARPFYNQLDNNEDIAGAVFVFRDVTLRHQAKLALERSNEELEQLVEARTRDLRTAQRKLLDMAHQSGRAEVAASVLHNVGNVLNSVNVAAMVAAENLQGLPLRQFDRAVELLKAHRGDGEFWCNDRKGRMIPAFLAQIGDALRSKRDVLSEQIRELTDHLEHMRRIIEIQNRMTIASPVVEHVRLSEVVDDALRINEAGIRNRQIEIRRTYTTLPVMQVERHKVLQILVNLIKNAINAVLQNELDSRLIELCLTWGKAGYWQIAVRDNGVGIAEENLGELFRFGFTTRKDGHGIGLHSCANVAKELGGALTATSAGLGHGACFVLEVPVEPGPSNEVGDSIIAATTTQEILITGSRDVGGPKPNSDPKSEPTSEPTSEPNGNNDSGSDHLQAVGGRG